MDHCCRELFVIIDISTSLDKVLDMPIGDTMMNVSIHEDNVGSFVLACTFSPQFTPRIKFYVINTIWFRQDIFKRGIKPL